MLIERVQIEEGFLDGLDVRLTSGLNTIIGARGTGKTSIIELIRFCLGAPSFTPETSKRSNDHARAVLRGGKVTVTLRTASGPVIVTRSGDSLERTASGSFDLPIILSQTEVESVGLQASGRLQLIDSFIPLRHSFQSQELAHIGSVKSLTTELEGLSAEINTLQEGLNKLPEIEASILVAEEKERTVAAFSSAAAAKQTELDQVSLELTKYSVRDTYVARFQVTAGQLLQEVYQGIKNGPVTEEWSSSVEVDPLATSKQRYRTAVDEIIAGYNKINAIVAEAAEQRNAIALMRSSFESRARALRTEIESIMEGSGAIVREGAKLRETRAQLKSLSALLESKMARKQDSVNRRRVELENLDSIRNARFVLRAQVCDEINSRLGPRIRVEIDRASQVDNYGRILTEQLKGSGIRYNELSKTIVQLISPRELTEAVERDDYEHIAQIAAIPKDRAIRLIAQFQEAGLGEISTCLVEDDARFMLLDGTDFKDISELSTGQRCTIILPVVLAHQDKIVIVDQPEDHIDNAFIAETLIRSLLGLSEGAQIIFTTHNANIPVLGNANEVIQMASDGRRGYVRLADRLEEPGIVDAISSVMEGGREAFQRRSEFYVNSERKHA